MQSGKIRTLTKLLFASGVLNILLLALIFYWIVHEINPESDFALKPAPAAQSSIDYSNAEVLRKYRTMPLEQLFAKLQDAQVVENGYAYRDLALSALVTFHHFDLQRALQGLTPPSQQRSIAYGKTPEGAILDAIAFPGLTEKHFQAIANFAATEQWPLTNHGLFLLLQKQNPNFESSLSDTFALSPEYSAVDTLFKRSEKNIDRSLLLTLVSQGDWQQLFSFSEEQRAAQDLSPARRQKFLLDYINKGSKAAAQILLRTDAPFAVNKLEDVQVVALIKLLTEKTPEAERYALVMLTSPRGDAVWTASAAKLFAFANEPLPEKNLHHAAVARFVPQALVKLAPNIAANPKKKDEKVGVPVKIAAATAKKVAQNQPKKIIAPQNIKKPQPKLIAKVVPPKEPKRALKYAVQQGDSLWKIARKFKVDVEVLKKYNKLKSDKLAPGTFLVIP